MKSKTIAGNPERTFVLILDEGEEVGREDDGGAAHDDFLHPVGFGNDPGPFDVGERAAHLQRNLEFFGELDAARVHDAGAHAR